MHIGVSPLARHGAPVFPVSGTFDGQQQCYHYAPVYDHDGITLIPADFPHDLRVCSTLVRHLPTRPGHGFWHFNSAPLFVLNALLYATPIVLLCKHIPALPSRLTLGPLLAAACCHTMQASGKSRYTVMSFSVDLSTHLPTAWPVPCLPC